MPREHRFELRLSDEEVARLKELAESMGVSQADALRMALRDNWARYARKKV